MTVTLDNYSGDYSFEVLGDHWMPRGVTLPAAGDTCLVVFDDDGDAWVTGWEGVSDSGISTHAALKTGVHGIPVMANGQGLVWDGTNWVATDVATQAEMNAANSTQDAALTAHAALTQTAHIVPIVATLPTTGLVDGMVVHYQNTAMATAGIVWRFRYRAAGGTYKWEFVGGPPLMAEVLSVASFNSTTVYEHPDTGTIGPQINLPMAGDYLVRLLIGRTVSTGAFFVYATVTATGLAAGTAVAYWRSNETTNNDGGSLVLETRAAISGTLYAQYAVSGGTGSVQYRHMTALPVRVG